MTFDVDLHERRWRQTELVEHRVQGPHLHMNTPVRGGQLGMGRRFARDLSIEGEFEETVTTRKDGGPVPRPSV